MHAPSRRLVFSRRLLAVLALLLVPLFLAVPPHLRQDPLIGPLADRYHVGLFLVLTMLLYRWGPLARRPVAVILVCLALGGATELLQVLAGRSAAFWDWYQDALGVGLGACWIWWRRSGKPLAPILGVVTILALVAWPLRNLPVTVAASRAAEARFPLLDDFEHPNADALWNGHRGDDITMVPAAGRGMVLQMSSQGDDRWPGASSRKLPYDWSGYTTLSVACRLVAPSPDSMRVSVWLEDRTGRYDSDYTLQSFMIGHQWQTVTVSLTDLVTHRSSRPLALEEIQGFSIFVSRRQPGPVVLQVDDLRLGGGNHRPARQGRLQEDHERHGPSAGRGRALRHLVDSHAPQRRAGHVRRAGRRLRLAVPVHAHRPRQNHRRHGHRGAAALDAGSAAQVALRRRPLHDRLLERRPLSEGCIAAGRRGGYFYLDWNGDISPCAFMPYAAANIKEVYAKGLDLSSVLDSGLFREICDWQEEYYGKKDGTPPGNLFMPCPMRDHHDVVHDAVL